MSPSPPLSPAPSPPPPRVPPLRARPLDAALVVAFASYLVVVLVADIASIVVADLHDLEAIRANPPGWPPLFMLEALAAYGRYCDPLLLHNPSFFRAIMWGDVLFLGPYYGFAIYAFWRGRDWIRIPTFLYGSHTLSYAVVLAWAHLEGPYASPRPAFVLAAYAPFWIVPLVAMWRVRRPHPFAPRRAPG